MESTTITEPIEISSTIDEVMHDIEVVSSSKSFIEANTIGGSLYEINNRHIIPVFVRENEPVISHGEFIDATIQAVGKVFNGETILKPAIRLSHPIKGRIPEARNKPASALLENEKTLYYERLAFALEIPTITSVVDGCRLNLTIGGVKAYNLDSLMTRNSEQHFKMFIGFQNKVCTNMCVSTDGFLSNLKVKSLDMLYNAILSLVSGFNAVQMANEMETFVHHELSDAQFAKFVGRCRMYRHMPDSLKLQIPDMHFGDAQINTVCKDYYADNSFCSNPDGSINLWRLYNLLTGANKSSYIDQFLDRSANAYSIAKNLSDALQNDSDCWFLN